MITKMIPGTLLMCCLAMPLVAQAEVLEVSGVGKAQITENIAATRDEAMQNAKRAAVIEAVKKLIGPSAPNDPKVKAAIEEMVVQISDDKISGQKPSKDNANNYVLRVTVRIDSLEFQKLLQTQGIASTADRNFPILVVMDEFFTIKTDNHSQKPLRELVEYSHDKTATSEASLSAAQNSSSNTRAAASDSSSASMDYADGHSSSGHSSGGYSGAYGGGGYSSGGRSSGYSAGSASARSKSSAEYANQSADAARLDTKSFDQKKDVVNYKKLVEYQPKNVGADKKSYTYEAILREARNYDMRMMDNDLFKSKYFNGKPLTMEEMQNSSELARYVAAARDNKAEYFMVGNSVIIDNGPSSTVGGYECDGLVTLKAYSTEDSSVLVADARSESASGNSPDQCRVNVANKLAIFVGKTVGPSIKDYWRQREVSGREYNIKLVSLLGNLSDDLKDVFAESIESIGGLQGKVIDRRSTRSEYEVAITYKGDKSVGRAISSALKKNDSFAKVGRKGDGTTLMFCLESACP